jgi:prepilin-type N-terminal cleavage/methylation domain-containing protein
MTIKTTTRRGFTLIEVILVVVISLILMGVSLPYFAHAYKGSKLRTSARTVSRMARYARSMAIMREKTMSVVLNPETMEIYLGAEIATSTNTADGEIDQDILKRLGYVDGEPEDEGYIVEKELHRFLPEGLEVRDFEKNWNDEDDAHSEQHIVRYYSDGQSEWFILEVQDTRGSAVKMESDPISGKIISEFTQ